MPYIKFILLLAAVVNARCPVDDKYCAYCIADQCAKCYDSDLIQGLCVNPIKEKRDCWIEHGYNICSKCSFGQFLTGDGQCLPVSTNATSLALCKTQNCARCNETGICLECVRGYVLTSEAQCIESIGVFEHCLRLVNSTCVQCRYNYYWSNGACLQANGYGVSTSGSMRLIGVLTVFGLLLN